MRAAGRWDDLATRMGSGLAMVVIGTLAIWAGGLWLLGLTAGVTGLIVWELSRMVAPSSVYRAMIYGCLSALVIAASPYVGAQWSVPLVAALALVAALRMPRDRVLFGLFLLAILASGYALVTLRAHNGMLWLFWVVAVVVVTDVFGYFAGRFIGGRKFWPRVSPNKTWAGTMAGWIGAAGAGVAFMAATGGSVNLIWVSVLLSMASQAGDISQSAMKRRAGVKDSSALIPGHGGLFDRFDGVLGAMLFLLLLALVFDLPQVRS